MEKVLIKDSEGYYATRSGNIIGKSGIVLKPSINKDGYRVVSIKREGKFISQRVNRLIAQSFIPNPDEKPEVNHKNGVKTDDRVENLEWVTSKENQLHATRVLRKGIGENHPQAKITEELVHLACKMMVSGARNIDVVKTLGIGKETVDKIRAKAVWREIVNTYNFPSKSRSLSVETVEWICRELSEGKSSVEIKDMSTNPKVTLQVVKGIKGRRNYRWISEKFNF